MKLRLALIPIFVALAVPTAADDRHVIDIASKNFAENQILAEILAQKLERSGWPVERTFSLAGTMVCYQRLTKGTSDVYPEYTGTIAQSILKSPRKLSDGEIKARLAERGMRLGPALGFQNNYAIVVTEETAQAYSLRTIGDLVSFPEFSGGFSSEFMGREQDGWPPLSQAYNLPHTDVRGMEHAQTYRYLRDGVLDFTDAYTTDPEIAQYNLVSLADTQAFFPTYDAHFLYRDTMPQAAKAALEKAVGELEASLDEAAMQRLNGQVKFEGCTVAEVATAFLDGALPVCQGRSFGESMGSLVEPLLQHLGMTLAGILLGLLLSVPLGLLAHRRRRFRLVLQPLVNFIQTIPGIALLVLFSIAIDIATIAVILALFVYSLLPIFNGVLTALDQMDPRLRESAQVLGMSQRQLIFQVELPLVMPHLIGGLRTATVIAVANAALAGWIGAGALGKFIYTGYANSSIELVLMGTIPAALLAIVLDLLLLWSRRWIISPGLRT